MECYEKDPSAVLDYSVDWTDWLSGGEVIASSSWGILARDYLDPRVLAFDPLKNGATGYATDTVATCWVEGGRPWRTYRLTNQITTDAGRVNERSVEIKVREQ